MSPRIGTLLMVWVFWSCIRPPMTMVSPSRIPGSWLSAERLSKIGALTLLEIGTVELEIAEICGSNAVHDDQSVGIDVRRHVENNADRLIRNVVDDISRVRRLRVGDDRHLLADEDRSLLIVAGEYVGPRQDVYFSDSLQSRIGAWRSGYLPPV